MSKRDVFAIAVKVVGVSVFASTLVSMPWIIEQINMTLTGRFFGVSNKPLFVTMSVGTVVVGLWIGAYLATKGDSLARWLESDEREIDLQPAEWVQPMFGVASRIVGIVLIAHTLPILIKTFAEGYILTHNAGGGLHQAFSSDFWAWNWSALIQNFATILIGAYLLFGAMSLARLVFAESRNDDNIAVQ